MCVVLFFQGGGNIIFDVAGRQEQKVKHQYCTKKGGPQRRPTKLEAAAINTVVRLCQFLVLAGNRFWFYILIVQFNCGVVLVFWSWQEIAIDFMYVFSVQYSCTVVSVFWLWQEIVLKMRTRFYKKNLLGYFIMIR